MALERVSIDYAGVVEILRSTEFEQGIGVAAEKVAVAARASGHVVTSGEPLPIDVYSDSTTERVGWTVVIRHPAGLGMEAPYGVLKRAAEASTRTMRRDRPRACAGRRRRAGGAPSPWLARRQAEQVQVSTETSAGPDGGPPTSLWLLVGEDGHTWQWPAMQRAVIRLTVWHRNPHSSKALAGLALGLLCAPTPPGLIIRAEPIAAPLAAIDPYMAAPPATCAAAVFARTRNLRFP
jgi:hypothetical protein